MVKISQFMILNFLVLIFCLPIITAGASITAFYTVMLKIVRNEESYLVKDYCHAFKTNFKQSTIIWLIMVAVGCILYFDIILSDTLGGMLGATLKIVFLFLGIVLLMVLSYIFAVQARFQNTIKGTFYNSFWMAMGYLPYTISILVIEVFPCFLIFVRPRGFWYVLPVMIVIGISLVGYACSLIFSHIFKKYMPDEGETRDTKSEEIAP